jgi:YfiH family protein
VSSGATSSFVGTPGVLSLGSLGVEHGFTTRTGGVSSGDYASLNLGLSSGDERAAVERNRDILLAHLGVDRHQVCAFNQVHGDRVLVGRPTWFEEDADAAITDRDDLLLVVSAADCFPVLFHDAVTGAVGAAHCGWRGTEARLVERVVEGMQREYGTRPSDLRVVVGPGIRGTCYQVAAEVATRFVAAGFPEGVVVARPAGAVPGAATSDADGATYLLDLEAAIDSTLTAAGVRQDSIEWLGRCTHCEPDVFFSHRRDAGRTGRLWGFVRAGAPGAALPVAEAGGGA